MTAPRTTAGGALWTEQANQRARLTEAAIIADPAHAGDLTLAASGTPAAELRDAFGDGDAWLLDLTARRALVPDLAHPGDYTFGAAGTSGALVYVADPTHPGDLILGTGTPAADLRVTHAGDETLLVRPGTRVRRFLSNGTDMVLH